METKNFKLPDKIGATVITGLVALGALYGLYRIEPYLIEFAQNTIYLAVMGVGAFLLVSTLWSSREAIWYWQQNQVRRLRRAIIAEDPVGILKSVITRMQEKEEELTGNIEKARGALARLKKQREDFTGRAQNELSMAQVARTQDDKEQHAVAASRWQKAADNQKPMIDLLSEMASKFQDALALCRRSIADATNQAEVLDATLAAMKEGQSTIKGFRRFMGNNPELQMQREAVAEIELQASNAEASIDQFLQDITPVLEQSNLQQQADAKSALAKFGATLSKQALPSGGVVEGTVVPSVKETVAK